MAHRRLSIVLSVVQTVVTVSLTLWADKMDWLRGHFNRVPPGFYRLHLLVIALRDIWRGVNGPTVPFNLTEPGSVAYRQTELLGLSVAELLYFVLVAALWYWVGHLLDERKRTNAIGPEYSRPKSRLHASLIVGWGLFVLVFAIFQLPEVLVWGRIFRLVPFFKVLFYMAWSLALVMLGAARLRASSLRSHTA